MVALSRWSARSEEREMVTRTLNLVEFRQVPFREFVGPRLEAAFSTLIAEGALRLDFSGASTDSLYQLTFVVTHNWTPIDRDRHWYRPLTAGVTGRVDVEKMRRRNFCTDVADAASCEAVARELPRELGQSIVYTAAHEAGHILGLESGGVDGSAHVGDAGNFMFINSLHADFVPLMDDFRRTRRYRIRPGDSLSRIADHIGFRPPLETWTALYNFRGQDGRRNRDLLRSGNPNLIFPNEEIWVPDYVARRAYFREVEICDKRFTPEQVATMRRFLAIGLPIDGIPI